MAHNSKYYLELLQICTYLKLHLPQFDENIPQAIKLMTIDQLYANIIHDKFETTLMKKIIILILQKVQNSKFQQSLVGGAKHFLIQRMSQEKQVLYDHYYVQMAIQQYLILGQPENTQHKKYIDTFFFYQLSTDFKFKLLSTLVKNANETLTKQKSSKTKQKSNEEKKQEKKEEADSKANVSLSQILILGQDGSGVYFLFPFMLNYVVRMQLGKWQLLSKESVLKLVQKLLKKQKSVEHLSLIQNLVVVHERFMKTIENEAHFRLHELKQKPLQKQRKRVGILKAKLLDVNQRYEVYLKNYDNKRWGFLKYRKNYVENVQKAKSMKELIEAYKDFYISSAKAVYKCLSPNEQDIPEHDAQQYYHPIKKFFCNINTVCNSLGFLKTLKVEDLALRLIQDEPADSYALFQFIVLWLQNSLGILQEKARRYYEKVRKAKLAEEKQKQKEKEKESIIKNDGSKMQLRKKAKKIFGVTMLDSDDQSMSFASNSNERVNNFASYQYKTRSRNI